VSVTLLRDGQTMALAMRPEPQTRFDIGDIGVLPDIGPRVQSLFPGDPAERAGLMVGDEVVAVNGQRVAFTRQLSETLRSNAGKEIVLTVRRTGEELQFPMTPESRDGFPAWIGITMAEASQRLDLGPLEAVQMSIDRNIEGSGLIFRTLGGLFIGQTSIKQLQGPVAIAQLSGESAAIGWIALFSLMATLSLNLGILNLLPIPMLDGGHILIMGLEGVARRDFSMAVKEKMLLAGFVLILMLMVTVIYNDLTRISWLERLMPWRS
jgi:regulator of sigma E protease